MNQYSAPNLTHAVSHTQLSKHSKNKIRPSDFKNLTGFIKTLYITNQLFISETLKTQNALLKEDYLYCSMSR